MQRERQIRFMKIEENEVYTTKEVAQILKISLPTVKRMLKDGRLKSTRIGRQHRFLGRELLDILRTREDLRRPEERGGDVAAPQLPATELSPVEKRQRDYMLGRRVAKTISDDDGNVLFPSGMTVNEDTIIKAKRRHRMMELFAALERES